MLRSLMDTTVGTAMLFVCASQAYGQPPAGSPTFEEAAQRVYETGPLTQRDFQAAIPDDDQGLDAWTTTDLNYRYRYEVRVANRRAHASITGVDVQAVVVPGQSWNRQPDNARLMDHEQGHFDLTQIAALRARLYFAQQSITRSAPTAQRAVQSVETELQQRFQEFVDALKREHEEYDRLTDHGRSRSEQREQRQRQLEQLASLTEQWQNAQAAGGTRPKARPGRVGAPP
jgi:hypothetical protein